MRKIATIAQDGRFVKIYCDGVDITSDPFFKTTEGHRMKLQARDDNKVLHNDGSGWYIAGTNPQPNNKPERVKKVAEPIEDAVVMELKATESVESTDIENVVDFVHNQAPDLKPKHFFINDLKWKYLVRAVMRGRNIMMTGPAGTGKTMAVKHIVNALQRPHFYFNLGGTQDPRATLIGNTHFKKDEGTYFAQSLFVTAIQTENAVILLDELSRAHPEAWNILMTVLDPNQRYLRLDEKDDSPTIKVAKNVSFIATANIGNEYTSTRTLDRALLDRFVVVEMDALNTEEERKLLKALYPKANKELLDAIAEIANDTRANIKSENPKVTTSISTRMTVEMGSLVADGFTLPEIAEVTIYPFYSEEGGVDSERTYMKQLVQKFIKTQDSALFGESDAVKTKTPF